MTALIDYLRERMNCVRACGYGFMVLSVVLGLAADKSHAHTWMEKYIPGFWAVFGLAAAGIIIGFAHWYGKSGIMTREDYYDE